ncbi:uncharacterized protein V6R79_021628 [Siganus canaliculatus]
MTVAVIVFCIILGLLSPAPAARATPRTACCTSYSKQRIPFQSIKGYREQSDLGRCRLRAIIFYTTRKNQVCVTRRDPWVTEALDYLSSRLKKMSKEGPAGGEPLKRQSLTTPFLDGSGSFFNSTEAFLNSSNSFY